MNELSNDLLTSFGIPTKAEPPKPPPSFAQQIFYQFQNNLLLSLASYLFKGVSSRRFGDVRPCFIVAGILTGVNVTVDSTLNAIDTRFHRVQALITAVRQIYKSALLSGSHYCLDKYILHPGNKPNIYDYIVHPVLITVSDQMIDLTNFGVKKILGNNPLSSEEIPTTGLEKLRRFTWKVISFGKSLVVPVAKKVDQLFSYCLGLRTMDKLDTNQVPEKDYGLMEHLRYQILAEIPHFLQESAACLMGSYAASKWGYRLYPVKTILLGELGRSVIMTFVETFKKMTAPLFKAMQQAEDREKQQEAQQKKDVDETIEKINQQLAARRIKKQNGSAIASSSEIQ